MCENYSVLTQRNDYSYVDSNNSYNGYDTVDEVRKGLTCRIMDKSTA